MPKKFCLTSDDTASIKVGSGVIVYDFVGCTYGIVADDNRLLGYEHHAVTLDPNGGSPFFTVAEKALVEIKDE